jgi:predicted ester cyclase
VCRRRAPDLQVTIEGLIAEDDKVVVRNHWTGTNAASQQRLEFSGIVDLKDRQPPDRRALGIP